MPKETFKYTNDEVTVVWKPNSCIHSAICWKGLIQVFNPKLKPWININGATTDRIIEQVKKCPSGALSYYMNANGEESASSNAVEPESGLPKIEVAANGPYIIRSACKIVHPDGSEETKTGTVSLCRCGKSSTKPFCDGSHKAKGFEG